MYDIGPTVPQACMHLAPIAQSRHIFSVPAPRQTGSNDTCGTLCVRHIDKHISTNTDFDEAFAQTPTTPDEQLNLHNHCTPMTYLGCSLLQGKSLLREERSPTPQQQEASATAKPSQAVLVLAFPDASSQICYLRRPRARCLVCASPTPVKRDILTS